MRWCLYLPLSCKGQLNTVMFVGYFFKEKQAGRMMQPLVMCRQCIFVAVVQAFLLELGGGGQCTQLLLRSVLFELWFHAEQEVTLKLRISCRVTTMNLQLVPYDAVNRNKVSIS
jgi:hypothetical protein